MSSKRKATSGAPATAKKDEPVDTSVFYAELAKLQGNQDFDKALKACNKILNVAPSDNKAFHCKIVCLLQLGKFDVALQQLADNAHLKVDLAFEKAYAFYRLNRIEEALETLENVKARTVKQKELQAQVLYRLERYEECFDLYREIIKNTSDDFETERLTNLSAVSVNLVQSKAKAASLAESEETYELCYNKACNLLAQGKWLEAENALKRSLEMCTRFLTEEEEEAQEDIDRETGIIRVQLGFAYQMQGRDREAQAMYNQVLKTKPADIGLIAVASNNLITLNKDQNIFDSKKRVKAATAEGLEHKLTSAHRRTIARNNALLAMYTNQVDLCRGLIKEMAEKFDFPKEDKDMIEAGVLARAGKLKEAVDILLKYGVKDLEKVLIAAQICLEKGEVREALSIFEKLPSEEKCRTGILSAMVTLYLALDDRANAAKLLKEAVKGNKSGKSDMVIVWRKTAEFHLKGDEPSVAAQSLEELLKTNPSDRQTLAQLVLAYSKFDLSKALEASKKLPDFSHGSVDVDALESSAFLGAKYAKKGGVKGLASPKLKTPGGEGEDLARKKTKKKRKKRLPKDFNPDVDPDLERWLPKRERTGYRKTRKERRKGEKFTGAQGTAAGQSDNFDYSKKTGAVPKQSTKSPAVEAPVGPRQQQRKPQQKKKGKSKSRF